MHIDWSADYPNGSVEAQIVIIDRRMRADGPFGRLLSILWRAEVANARQRRSQQPSTHGGSS